MAKTKRQIAEDLRLIDVVIEILDARIPISSQNPDMRELTKNKKTTTNLGNLLQYAVSSPCHYDFVLE